MPSLLTSIQAVNSARNFSSSASGMPVAGQRNVQHEVAVLAHDVHQHLRDLFGRLVSVLVEKAPLVMPVPDAGVRLPGQSLPAVLSRRARRSSTRARRCSALKPLPVITASSLPLRAMLVL